MKRTVFLSTFMCAVAVAKLQGAVAELDIPPYEGLLLEETREKPVLLWDRYTDAIGDRAGKAFNRLRPLYSLRILAPNDLRGPERINDVAYSTMSRLLGYGGNVLITESEPYIYLRQETRAFGDFVDASVRDIFENIGEFFSEEIAGHDPELRPYDLMPDPEGTNIVGRLSPWKHSLSYGIGIKGGGPSVFFRGRMRYHNRVWGYYDTRANIDGLDGEVKFHQSLVFPLTKTVQFTTGLAWSPFEEKIRCVFRLHFPIGIANCITSASFTDNEMHLFVGANIRWWR